MQIASSWADALPARAALCVLVSRIVRQAVRPYRQGSWTAETRMASYRLELFDYARVTTLYQYMDDELHLAECSIKGHNRPSVLSNIDFKPGQRVLGVGEAYSELPALIATTYGCEVWVADDFGMAAGEEELWSRWGDPAELQRKYPQVRHVYERMGTSSQNIPESYFDVIFSVSTLEHIPAADIPSVFSHMDRCLRPGGVSYHTIDVPMPIRPFGTSRWRGIAGVIAYGLGRRFYRLRASREEPYLREAEGWRKFLSQHYRKLDNATPSRFPSMLEASLDPDILTEPIDVIYQHYFKQNGRSEQFPRIGSLVVKLRQAEAA